MSAFRNGFALVLAQLAGVITGLYIATPDASIWMNICGTMVWLTAVFIASSFNKTP